MDTSDFLVTIILSNTRIRVKTIIQAGLFSIVLFGSTSYASEEKKTEPWALPLSITVTAPSDSPVLQHSSAKKRKWKYVCPNKDECANYSPMMVGAGFMVGVLMLPILQMRDDESRMAALLQYNPELDICYLINSQNEDEFSSTVCASNSTDIGIVSKNLENSQTCIMQGCEVTGVLRIECNDDIRGERCENAARVFANQEKRASKTLRDQPKSKNKSSFGTKFKKLSYYGRKQAQR